MRYSSGILSIVILVVALIGNGCTKKNIPVRIKLVLGNDTITTVSAKALDPLSATDSARIFNSGVRMLLSARGGSVDDTTVTLFAERLLLVSDVEWSFEGARLLLLAARGMELADDSTRECNRVTSLADTLSKKLKSSSKEGLNFTIDTAWVTCSQQSNESRQDLQLRLLATVLGINHAMAQLCFDFVYKKDTPPIQMGTTHAKKLVTGLLSSGDSTPALPQKTIVPAAATPLVRKKQQSSTASPSTGIEALKYRNETSIRDSVTKHIPNLRQLYKKRLKADALLNGTVVITFEVAPDGSVAGTAIKSTEIAPGPFLDGLCAYLRTIHFQSIPETAGKMIFDFPFEFNAEM